MTKEEFEKVQVGDKVVLPDGEESIILTKAAGACHKEFACLDKIGSFCFDQEKLNRWRRNSFPIIENYKDYMGQKFEWLYFDKIELIKTEESNSCKESNSCVECGGTGVIDTGFYTRICGCKLNGE